MLELPWLMGLQLFDRGKTKKKGLSVFEELIILECC